MVNTQINMVNNIIPQDQTSAFNASIILWIRSSHSVQGAAYMDFHKMFASISSLLVEIEKLKSEI
jgi:hypothetical protein